MRLPLPFALCCLAACHELPSSAGAAASDTAEAFDRLEAGAFPDPGSKKGLSVQMADDAIALGVRHASLNVLLGPLIDPASLSGPELALREEALAELDAQVRPLAQAGVVIYFILLGRPTGDERVDARLLDARGLADPDAPPEGYRAFRADEVGTGTLRSICRALALRYARHGVRGWIVGNEVNSHHWWYSLGPASSAEVADAYERATRAVWQGVGAADPQARVYLSFEHHWFIRYPAGTELQSCSGRELLLRIAALARERGDFPWHLAFHPYPEDLFDCRFWEDDSARPEDDTPRITFRNLEVLERALADPRLTWHGSPRRVILSEQGFHCLEGAEGERLQAAAYAAAWRTVARRPGIDAFILHRHVDHAHEGGLRLGLWERAEGSVNTPGRRRRIWDLFRAVDGAQGTDSIRAALAEAGLPAELGL